MPIETFVPVMPVLVYDGTNSAEFVSLWEGQPAPVTSADAVILSENGGVLTLQLDASVDNVVRISEGVFELAEGDGLGSYLTWPAGGNLQKIDAQTLADFWVVQGELA
jgi:hypothetical protein